MLTQRPLRQLFADPSPRPARCFLSSVPDLLVTERTAELEGNVKDLRTVADCLKMLIDGASSMTPGDRALVRRLYEMTLEIEK